MNEMLKTVEKNLCNASSVIRLIRLADYDDCAIDVDNALEMIEEIIDSERLKLTSLLIQMQIERSRG